MQIQPRNSALRPLLLALSILGPVLELLPAQTQTYPRYLASYFGGNGNERVQSVALGSKGEIFIAGVTQSRNLPTQPGSLQKTYGGQGDAFVAALSADGRRLLACTYLGGTLPDEARHVQVMSDGTVWVGGVTRSSTFPVTTNGLQPAPKNGRTSAFFVHLSANLVKLYYGTCFGGRSGNDQASQFLVHEKDRKLFLAGYTHGGTVQSGIPTTASALRRTPDARDAWLAVLDISPPKSTRLDYATYLGGSGVEIDVDALGLGSQSHIVSLSGTTHSTDLPVTTGCFQPSRAGSRCGFFMILDLKKKGKQALNYSTYFGGSGDEYTLDHVWDPSGYVHLLTSSGSANLLKSPKAMRGKGKGRDLYYAQLDPTKLRAAAQVYGSWVVSGSSTDGGAALGDTQLRFHPRGLAFITTTFSPWWTLPHSPGAFQSGLPGNTQTFVGIIDLVSFRSPTYVYGSSFGSMTNGTSWSGALAVDAQGDLIFGGHAGKDLPVTLGRYQKQPASSFDGYVAKLEPKAWPRRFSSLGSSCLGSAGKPTMVGKNAGIGAHNGKSGRIEASLTAMVQHSLGVMHLGSGKQWGALKLPMRIPPTGCDLQVSPTLGFAFKTLTGSSTFTLPLPLDTRLIGIKVGMQGVIIDPKANAAGFVFTNGLLIEIGW